jgi:hypothetical protein
MEDSKTTHQNLLKVMEDDFDGCEWFIISANELMKTLNDLSEMYKDKETSLEAIKNSIGKIGIGIGNVQKCLDGVEDCYSKSVEVLGDEMDKLK